MENSESTNSKHPPRHIICVGTVVVKDAKVLLVRQAAGHQLEGQWSLPWGFVDEFESPDEAASRETLEESNVEVKVIGLLGIQELHNPGWLAMVFLGRHVEGTPASDGGAETDQARYFTLLELMNIKEPIEPWCEWIAKRVLQGGHTVVPFEADNPYTPLKAFL